MVNARSTWLKARKIPTEGWARASDSYALQSRAADTLAAAYQTAWALLG